MINKLILKSYCMHQDDYDTYNCDLKERKEVDYNLDEVMNKLKMLLSKEPDTYFEIDEAIGSVISYESRRCYFAGFVDGANLIMDIKR